MDKIKCNIEVDVDKGLFYAISAFLDDPLSEDTIDAMMNNGSYNISLSDLKLPHEQKQGLSLAMASIIVGKQLEKEEGKEKK